MKLSDVGEQALVESARRIFKSGGPVRIGIGDDAAAFDIGGGKCLVVTTDMLTANVHFPLGTKPEQIGHKAVVVNLSDLAAMGAKPLALVFSVALPRDLEVDFAKRIMKGMETGAKEYGAYVVGGDLDESREISIAGTAFGIAKREELLRRSSAEEGDVVAVTGNFGAASVGLKILLEKMPMKGYENLVKAQLMPNARVKEGMALAKNGSVRAAIDVSDGLSTNLWHLARESKVKLVIDKDKIPVNPLAKKFCLKNGLDIDEFFLFGGEDFELIFTAKRKKWTSIEKTLKRLGTGATEIGSVEKGRGVILIEGKKTRPLEDRGFEHYK